MGYMTNASMGGMPMNPMAYQTGMSMGGPMSMAMVPVMQPG